MLHQRGLTALCTALCLVLQLSWGEGLRIALIPDPQEEVINPFAHELAAYAAGLGKLKHNVTLLPDVEDDEKTLDGLLGSSNRTQDAYYDVVLTQGTKAALIADYAARLHVPVVRFISKGAAVGAAAPHPLYERPAALVFASEEDEHAFDIDQMAEALRLVVSPAKTRMAISSGAAYSAVDRLVREVLQAYNPHPALEQKTLGLVMIVKDEVATINITLGSMRDHIDEWTIVDTGSTDGTQDMITSYMKGYPGELFEEPFVDFSTTRNYALRKHGQKTAYAFMVDADFAVNGTWRLRIAAQRMQQECQHRSIPYCAKAMQIRIYSGTTVFFTTRVFPSQAMGTEDGWQYFYPVHESPSNLQIGYMNSHVVADCMKFPDVKMWNLPITHNKSSNRWKNLDLPLLTKEHKLKPHDTRVVFYLAQTLDLIDDLQAALDMYQKRIDMGGWQQEIFEAHMRRGRIKHDRMAIGEADPRPDFLAAHQLYPYRAEPLIWMCWHHHKMMDNCSRGPQQETCWVKERAAAYYYSRKAAALPMPEEGLFINKPVYDYQSLDALLVHAYYTTKHLTAATEVGYNSAFYVQRKKPGPPHRARNALLYLQLRQADANQDIDQAEVRNMLSIAGLDSMP